MLSLFHSNGRVGFFCVQVATLTPYASLPILCQFAKRIPAFGVSEQRAGSPNLLSLRGWREFLLGRYFAGSGLLDLILQINLVC